MPMGEKILLKTTTIKKQLYGYFNATSIYNGKSKRQLYF